MANRRFLLDTNVLLAALIAPERLSSVTKEILQDPVSEVFFSAASIWEIAIKSSLGRDDFDFESKDIQQLADETGFVEMPILSKHCHAVARLPWHHRDPFDRVLVSQARVEGADLLTRDRTLARYSELVNVIEC